MLSRKQRRYCIGDTTPGKLTPLSIQAVTRGIGMIWSITRALCTFHDSSHLDTHSYLICMILPIEEMALGWSVGVSGQCMCSRNTRQHRVRWLKGVKVIQLETRSSEEIQSIMGTHGITFIKTFIAASWKWGPLSICSTQSANNVCNTTAADSSTDCLTVSGFCTWSSLISVARHHISPSSLPTSLCFVPLETTLHIYICVV